MNKSRVTLLLFFLVFGMLWSSAKAAVDVNINYISGYYDVPQPTAVVYEQKLGSWQDVATLFFLSRLTGTSPDIIVGWRVGGTPWVGIVQRLNVPASVFYVPYQNENDYFAYHQGPPYGNAWGYWRNHRLVLSDDAIRRRVALLGTSHYYGIPVTQEIRQVSGGGRGSFENVNRQHAKHGGPHFSQETVSHGRWQESQQNNRGGKGQGQGRGQEGNPGDHHDKGNGNSGDHGHGKGH